MEKYGRHRGVREAQEQGHAFPAEGAAEGPERRGRQEANDGRGTTLRKAEEEAVDRRQLVLFGNQYTKQLELPPQGLNHKASEMLARETGSLRDLASSKMDHSY